MVVSGSRKRSEGSKSLKQGSDVVEGRMPWDVLLKRKAKDEFILTFSKRREHYKLRPCVERKSG